MEKLFEGVYTHLQEVSNVERECRTLYGVQPKERKWRQYNLGRVEEGYFYYEESIEKEKKSAKMNPEIEKLCLLYGKF